MGIQRGSEIKPAQGKLGVLLPGMGAVATTFIAGVEAIRRGLAQPVGSLTQLGTIRIGKRTENKNPKISDFVPLAGLDDLVFGRRWRQRTRCLEPVGDRLRVPALRELARLPGHAREAARSSHHRQGLEDRPDADQDGHRARPQGAHARCDRLVLDQHPRQPRR
jgi:hypothetical protein